MLWASVAQHNNNNISESLLRFLCYHYFRFIVTLCTVQILFTVLNIVLNQLPPSSQEFLSLRQSYQIHP